jgi:hypothetical protein
MFIVLDLVEIASFLPAEERDKRNDVSLSFLYFFFDKKSNPADKAGQAQNEGRRR